MGMTDWAWMIGIVAAAGALLYRSLRSHGGCAGCGGCSEATVGTDGRGNREPVHHREKGEP